MNTSFSVSFFFAFYSILSLSVLQSSMMRLHAHEKATAPLSECAQA